jgi:hypothetical protein
LLRRLPIIIIEDAQLCEDYDALVFLMMACAAGLTCSRGQVQFVLSLVQRVCQDCVIDIVPASAAPSAAQAATEQELACLTPAHASLIRALRVRAVYGGLPGDVALVNTVAREWINRFAASDASVPAATTPTTTTTTTTTAPHAEYLIPRRGPGPWPVLPSSGIAGMNLTHNVPSSMVAGVDSHCQPRVFDHVCAGAGISADELHTAMWLFRGSVRFRVPRADFRPQDPVRTAQLLRAVEVSALKRQLADVQLSDERHQPIAETWKRIRVACENASIGFLKRMTR